MPDCTKYVKNVIFPGELIHNSREKDRPVVGLFLVSVNKVRMDYKVGAHQSVENPDRSAATR